MNAELKVIKVKMIKAESKEFQCSHTAVRVPQCNKVQM